MSELCCFSQAVRLLPFSSRHWSHYSSIHYSWMNLVARNLGRRTSGWPGRANFFFGRDFDFENFINGRVKGHTHLTTPTTPWRARLSMPLFSLSRG